MIFGPSETLGVRERKKGGRKKEGREGEEVGLKRRSKGLENESEDSFRLSSFPK